MQIAIHICYYFQERLRYDIKIFIPLSLLFPVKTSGIVLMLVQIN